MSLPKSGITLFDATGAMRDLDEVIETVKRMPGRLIVEDDIGISVDLAGLGFQTESMDWKAGQLRRADVSELRKRRRSARILRITTGSGIAVEVVEDTLLHVRDESGAIHHVRADKLKPGMDILAGDKDDGTPGFIVY